MRVVGSLFGFYQDSGCSVQGVRLAAGFWFSLAHGTAHSMELGSRVSRFVKSPSVSKETLDPRPPARKPLSPNRKQGHPKPLAKKT